MKGTKILIGNKRLGKTNPTLIIDYQTERNGCLITTKWHLFCDALENHYTNGELNINIRRGEKIPEINEEMVIEQLKMQALDALLNGIVEVDSLYFKQLWSVDKEFNFTDDESTKKEFSRRILFEKEEQIPLIQNVIDNLSCEKTCLEFQSVLVRQGHILDLSTN